MSQQARNEDLHIKINKWEKEQLTKQAEASGQTLSQYVRGFAYLSPEEMLWQAAKMKTKALKQ